MVTDEFPLEVDDSEQSDDSLPPLMCEDEEEPEEISRQRLLEAFQLAKSTTWVVAHRGPEPTDREKVFGAPGFYTHQEGSSDVLRFVNSFTTWVSRKDLSAYQATNLLCYLLRGKIAQAVSERLQTNFRGYQGILDFVSDVARRGRYPAWCTDSDGRPDPFKREPRDISRNERLRQSVDHTPCQALHLHQRPIPEMGASTEELRQSMISLQATNKFLIETLSAVACKQRQLLSNLERIGIDTVADRVVALTIGQRDLAFDVMRQTRCMAPSFTGDRSMSTTKVPDDDRLSDSDIDQIVDQGLVRKYQAKK